MPETIGAASIVVLISGSIWQQLTISTQDPAVERLSSGFIEEVIVTNTIPVSEAKQFKQLTVLSVANLIGEAIWRIHEDSSVSSMFR